MQPCACGVVHETDSGCPSLPLMQEVLSKSPVQQAAGNIESNEPVEADENKQTSTLIVFPGTGRPVPEWRKQLSQRVREVQEQRAREAAEVAAAMQQAETVSCTLPSAQLELVPDREQPAMNPIVSKALERVDRARKSEFASSELAAPTTAPALAPVSRPQTEPEQTTLPLAAPRTNLVVVPPSKAKSMRVMSDDLNGAALGYLDSYLSIPALKTDSENRATFARRTTAALFDLVLVVLLSTLVVAAIEFTGGNWIDSRVIGLAGGITIVSLGFYLTLSIAFTGRTIGMRWLSLRTIDVRTGLIPTGGQSIKRTIGYLLSLAPLGLGVIYALIDPDGRTLYDRFSKTTVVRS